MDLEGMPAKQRTSIRIYSEEWALSAGAGGASSRKGMARTGRQNYEMAAHGEILTTHKISWLYNPRADHVMLLHCLLINFGAYHVCSPFR